MGQLVHPVGDILRFDEKRSAVKRNRNPLSVRKNLTADISTHIVTDVDDFYSLQKGWDVLAGPSGNPLLQFAWYASCVDAFSRHGRLYTIVVREWDEIVAIAPLREVHGAGMKRFEILGSNFLCEPCGLLFKDTAALEILIHMMLDLKRPISTGRLDNASPESELFKAAGKMRFAVQAYHATHSPWLPISTSWDEYQKTISPSKRSALRRAHRHATEHGTVTMEVIAPHPGDMQDSLDEIYDAEHASWKGRTRTSIRSNPHMEKFFNSYAKKMAAAGALRLSILRINGTTVAGQIGIEFANKFWVLKVGYDERFSHCSPGILLMHHTIQHAYENKLQAFEFLGRDEQWIRMWTEKVHHYTSYWHYPINPASLLWLVKDGYTFASAKINALMNGKNHDKKN